MQRHENMENEESMQKEMLKQFRRNLSDVIRPNDTDAVLLKWLRAKNFHLGKSEIAYREYIWARNFYKCDHLAEIWTIPEVIHKYEFANQFGIAKDGTPVRYIAMGRGDLKGFVMSIDSFDIFTYASYVIEGDLKISREQGKKLGKDINEVTYIIDMEGFNLKQLFFAGILELALDLCRLLQDYYPEVWRNIFIVNAASYFSTVFCLIQPALRHTILKDFHVLTRDQTPRYLLKYVDEDVLPAFLGGTRLDSQGSPMCKEFMKFGGRIPEEYYLRNHHLLQPSDKDVTQVMIYRKSCYNLSYAIRQTDSAIQYEFRTEGGSITLCILFRKFGSDPENPDLPSRNEYLNESDEKCKVELISPYSHIQSHLSPVKYRCFPPRPGIYIFKFDNSYNWLSSRKLIYRFQVQSADV